MPRPIWKGHLSFGLVLIPVTLSSIQATEEAIDFDLLDRRDNARVRYMRMNERTGKEVPWKETVRGVDVGSGKYVVLTPEDFKRAAPKATRAIEISGFVERDEIAPKFFERPYAIEPQEGGEKGYAILRDALEEAGKVGIAQVVLHTKQHLAALLSDGPMLTLNTLRYSEELRGPREFARVPSARAGSKATRTETQMAATLIEGMTVAWKPESYGDTYHDTLKKWIKQRTRAGSAKKVAEVEEEEDTGPGPYSIMELLKKSVEESKRSGRSSKHSRPPQSKPNSRRKSG